MKTEQELMEDVEYSTNVYSQLIATYGGGMDSSGKFDINPLGIIRKAVRAHEDGSAKFNKKSFDAFLSLMRVFGVHLDDPKEYDFLVNKITSLSIQNELVEARSDV